MLFNKKKRIRRFNEIASQYNRYAIVQKKMAYQLIQHLFDHNSSPEVVVEWGCGTGYLTQLLLDLFSPHRLIAIDFAKKMIQQAKAHVSSPNVKWVIGDIEEHMWTESLVDLIVSNSVLHWIAQPDLLVQQAWGKLQVHGQFVHTVMGPDTFQELRALLQQVEWELGVNLIDSQGFLRSAEEWKKIYQQAGFHEIEVIENWQRVEFIDCGEFFRTLQGLGVNGFFSDPEIWTADPVLSHVIQKYNAAYRTKRGVYATFHTILCSGEKRGRSS